MTQPTLQEVKHTPGRFDFVDKLYDEDRDEIESLRKINGHMLSALKAAEAEHLDMAALLDAWARESVEGSWSTHQVDAMRRRADQCRRHAAAVRAAISKAGGQ